MNTMPGTAARVDRQTDEEPIYQLKISEDRKYANDRQWFKDFLDYLVPQSTMEVEDYDQMKLAYDLVNGKLDGFAEELDRFCDPMGTSETTISSQLRGEKILPYNRIHNKVNTLVGEMLGRNDQYSIVLLSPERVAEKGEKYREAIKASVMERIQLEIQALQQEIPEEEKEQFIAQRTQQIAPEDMDIKEFKTDLENFYEHALKYARYKEEIKDQKQLSWKHVVIADRCFVKVGWQGGQPSIEVLNPLHCGFHKSPDVDRVEKGDYFWHRKAVTYADAYNELINKVDVEKIRELQSSSSGSVSSRDPRHNIINGRAEPITRDGWTADLLKSSQSSDKSIGQSMSANTGRRNSAHSLIWRTHIEFKAYREVYFITYMDEYGNEISDVADIKFEVPADATPVSFINNQNEPSLRYEWVDPVTGQQFSAEPIWIPRRYEATRYGDSLYINCREVPGQPVYLENPYRDFELSYKGRVFTNLNSESVSLVQRAMPFQFQYFFVKHIQNRELAKYRGMITDIDVDQIPDYLSLDENGEPIPGIDKVAIWETYLRKLGYNFYSGSQSGDGLPPSTRSPGSRSQLSNVAGELVNFHQMLQLIDTEIGMAMGIPPQREAMFKSNTNASDNQQAIAQAHFITEQYFWQHAEVWRHAMADYLRLFRTYCKRIFDKFPKRGEHMLNYVTPQGSPELLRVQPNSLDYTEIGLHVSDTGGDAEYRQMMMQMLQPLTQNQAEGVEVISNMIMKITSGSSPSEIHKAIQIEAKKQAEKLAAQQEAQMKQQQAMEEKLKQMEIDSREDKQEHDRDIVEMKGDYQLANTELTGEYGIEKEQVKLTGKSDSSVTPNEYGDKLEREHKMQMDRLAAAQENKRIRQADRELDIREKESRDKSSK